MSGTLVQPEENEDSSGTPEITVEYLEKLLKPRGYRIMVDDDSPTEGGDDDRDNSAR